MKSFIKFVCSFLLCFTLLFSSIVPVLALDDSQQLVNTRSAIAVSLYEELRNQGYEITVPFEYNSTFENVMKPMVDRILNIYEGVSDTFFYVGERLYYNVSKVKDWITDLFGSGDSGSFSSSSVVFDSNLYYQTLVNRKNFGGVHSNIDIDFGRKYNYPLLKNINARLGSGTIRVVDLIPIFLYSNNYVYSLGCKFDVSFNYSNGIYNFDAVLSPSYNFLTTDKIWNTYNWSNFAELQYGGSGSFYGYSRLWYSYSVSNPNNDLDSAFQDFCSYLLTNINSYTLWLSFNGQDYYLSPQSYTINRPSGYQPADESPYQVVNYQYITNNWGSADTIYNDSHDKNISNDFDIDLDLDLDFDFTNEFKNAISDLKELPDIFTSVSSGSIQYIDADSPSQNILSSIFTGLPSDIFSVFILMFVVLVVVGLINRLLG